MTPPPCSEAAQGLFVSVDGPSGAGKTTIVHHLAQLLLADGHNVHLTAEPSTGPIGRLCRELTEQVTGAALACLYAADRYHHLEHDIRPAIQAGHIVITDRYLASSLVMQRFDNLDPGFLWQLSSQADHPDLTVILTAQPATIAERLTARGPHNRFQRTPGSSHTETRYYQQATQQLAQAGFTLLILDCTTRPAQHTAALIRDRITACLVATPGDGTAEPARP